MSHSKSYEFLLKDISTLKGVGQKAKKLLKKKKIETLFDVLWHLPQAYVDRSNLINIDKVEIGKICTIKVQVIKYNFPRIRNLPNTVKCEDSTGKIDIVFFNSREGYIRKILPLNNWVIISGKVNFYNKKYQITNPAYVVSLEKENFIKKVIFKNSQISPAFSVNLPAKAHLQGFISGIMFLCNLRSGILGLVSKS